MTGYQMTHQPAPFEITDNAACRGSKVMFGVVRHSVWGGVDWEPARKVCDGCPVKDACLAHAIAQDERDGMWGGLAPHERRGKGKVCVECGERFRTTRYTGASLTCSDECRDKRARRRKNELRRLTRERAVGSVRMCTSCGDDFVRDSESVSCPDCGDIPRLRPRSSTERTGVVPMAGHKNHTGELSA